MHAYGFYFYGTHTNEYFRDARRCCEGTHLRETCTIVKMLVKILFNTHVGHFKMVVTIIVYYFTSALHFDAPCVCVCDSQCESCMKGT